MKLYLTLVKAIDSFLMCSCFQCYHFIVFFEEDDKLVFTETLVDHADGETVTNLSNLFLAEFFKKYKNLYTPGLEDRSFVSGLNVALFAKQAKDLYKTKGTDDSLRFCLYFLRNTGKNPNPENTIKPSDADYRVTEDLVVVLVGDPLT